MLDSVAVYNKRDISVRHAAKCRRGRGFATELLGGAAKISEVWEGVVRSSKTCAAFSGIIFGKIFSGIIFPIFFPIFFPTISLALSNKIHNNVTRSSRRSAWTPFVCFGLSYTLDTSIFKLAV